MLGEVLSLLAALFWSFSVVLFKRSEAASPNGLNLFKNVLAIFLLSVTLLVLGVPVSMERSQADWLRLIGSGALGLGIADTIFFMALRKLGPGLLAIMECAYSPTVILLAVLFLGEQLSWGFGLGALFVVMGVGWVSLERVARPPDMVQGVALGVLAVVCMAVGITIAKPALDHGHVVELTLIRLLAGVAVQLIWIVATPSQRPALAILRPQATWKTLIPASVLGSYLAMLCWLGGFKWADASVAAVLGQTSTIFTIALGVVVLKEPLTIRRAQGAALALAGTLTIILTG